MAEPKKLPNGKWRIIARYKSNVTGEWLTKSKTFKTAAECRAWATDLIASANLGHTSQSVKLGDYYDHWLKVYKEPFVEIKTIRRIKSVINHALKFFSPSKEIDQITKGNYQLWLNQESTNHSHETVLTMHTTFKAMMASAEDEGVILRNPCHGAKIGGFPQPTAHPKQSVLNLAQYKALLTDIVNSDDCQSKYICLLQAFTGLRIGEALGLTWDKIDFNKHTILVDGQFDYAASEKRTHLKDHTRPRLITVEPILFDYLSQYRRWQMSESIHSNVFQMTNYLFFNPQKGIPLTPGAPNKYLEKHCKAIGITRITTHGWRRTQATMMTYAKIDEKYIASFLGHTVETLQKYYVKETDDTIRQNQELRTNFLKQEGII